MEAASQNRKRGRPRSDARLALEELERLSPDVMGRGLRAKINCAYLSVALIHLDPQEKEFYTRGTKTIRCGILEQIGRLYDADLISEEEIPEIARICEKLYTEGCSVKEIERYLRAKRIEWTEQ